MELEMIVKDIECRWVSDSPEALDKNYWWASVAAKRKFSRGEIIEVCPILILSRNDSNIIKKTWFKLLGYNFNGRLAIPGGYGPIYCPSEEANASYAVIPEKRALVISADRDIRSEEFITVKQRGIPLFPEIKHAILSPWQNEGLVVRPSPGRGLGTFTTRKFKEGELVEVCHLFYASGKDSRIAGETRMNGYFYSWGSRGRLSGWAIGYPCFYNHSEDPNIYPWDELDSIKEEHIAVRAVKDLEPGTELLFDYNDGTKKLVF